LNRSIEDRDHLVSAKLEHLSSARLNRVAGEIREGLSEPPGGGGPPLSREVGPPTDVRDQGGAEERVG
jgi:hypothetical protein